MNAQQPASRARWGRKNKYGAKPVVDSGQRFDSTGEFKRWCELKLLERAGEIKDLQRQVRYKLIVSEIPICDYVADFAYYEQVMGQPVCFIVEDFKSPATTTPIFGIKRKLMKACHGIDVRVTGRGAKPQRMLP